MRTLIIRVLTWLFLGFVALLLFGVGGEWLIHVAEDKGLYNDAGQRWDTAMAVIYQFLQGLAAVTTSTPAVISATAVGTALLTLKLDRRSNKTPHPPAQMQIEVHEEVSRRPEPRSVKGAPEQATVLLGPNITITYLTELFSNKSTFEAEKASEHFIGKRMRFSIGLSDFSARSFGGLYAHGVEKKNLTYGDLTFPASVDCWMDFPENEKDRLIILRLGDVMLIEGTITDINRYRIGFKDCRLLQTVHSNQNIDPARGSDDARDTAAEPQQ